MRSEVASATRSQLVLVRRIEADIVAGTTATDMMHAAARERVSLAQGLLRIGDSLVAAGQSATDQVALRSSISRYYYAMFQAARAVVFIDFGGDDKNGHQELPRHLPKNFPQRGTWMNELKDARLRRNDADYDPYPSGYGDWLTDAQALQQTAHDFVDLVDQYLSAKGI